MHRWGWAMMKAHQLTYMASRCKKTAVSGVVDEAERPSKILGSRTSLLRAVPHSKLSALAKLAAHGSSYDLLYR